MGKKKGLYKTNKDAAVGDLIECPICHSRFIKRQYSQAFCNAKCKDKFWNAKGDRHKRFHNYDKCEMTDHDWDEAFEVAEYNV